VGKPARLTSSLAQKYALKTSGVRPREVSRGAALFTKEPSSNMVWFRTTASGILASLVMTAVVLLGPPPAQADEGKMIVFIFPKRGTDTVAHFTWTGTNAEWLKAEKFVQKTVESKYEADSYATGRIMPGHCGFLYIETTKSGQKAYYLSSVHDSRAAAQKEMEENKEKFRTWGWNYTFHDVVCAE
jgi:hypothetical protein